MHQIPLSLDRDNRSNFRDKEKKKGKKWITIKLKIFKKKTKRKKGGNFLGFQTLHFVDDFMWRCWETKIIIIFPFGNARSHLPFTRFSSSYNYYFLLSVSLSPPCSSRVPPPSFPNSQFLALPHVRYFPYYRLGWRVILSPFLFRRPRRKSKILKEERERDFNFLHLLPFTYLCISCLYFHSKWL